ncbi:MAG TPA: hypothetical protein HA348_05880 [Thermoplasmata archaeon]|nr:hypothetical protein [Thermoplasmata archaeon]
MEAIKKLAELEREVKNLRDLVLFERDALFEKKLVSLRGMGKLIVSEEELEGAIEEAKKSLFSSENVIRD